MTDTAKGKFKLLTDWINILSKWAVLGVFIFKAGQYTQQILGKMKTYDGYEERLARIDSTMAAQKNIDNRIHANIWGEIQKLKCKP